ncbi:MAG: nucleotidyltransferase family protein [Bacteroidales bacterium]|nr:nucleotidyltransferase family protein [Bacteroidales bacterium]
MYAPIGNLHRCLYGLLRVALRCPEPEGLMDQLKALSDKDWRDILSLAREQAVSGLVYEALSMKDGMVNLPEDVSLDLMMDASRIEYRSRYLQTMADSIIGALQKKGLHPLIMKGPSAANMYPVPSLRVSGDIDLYLPTAEVQKAREWLANSFRTESWAPDGSWHYNADGVEIDLHSHYFDLSVPERRLPQVPSPEATLLMLSSHILKHAMGPGVGLRQICDMVVASRALKGKFDPHMLRKYFRNTCVTRWNKMLVSMIRQRFGVDPGFFPVEDKAFYTLERIIFAGGNFGQHGSSRKRALTRSPRARKIDTAFRFVLRIPFSLYYAPKEYVRYFFALLKGNLAM